MKNDLSSEVFPQIQSKDGIIDAEWVDIETSLSATDLSQTELPQIDPAIVYLTPQPYYPNSDAQTDENHSAVTGATLLDRLLTPWGIAGCFCLLAGNILLAWFPGSHRPAPVAQIQSLPAIDVNSAPSTNLPGQFPPTDRQLLNIAQLSGVKVSIPATPSAIAALPSVVVIPSTGTSLATAILPTSPGSLPLSAPGTLPIASSQVPAPAIAKAPQPSSPPKPALPAVPLVLQPRSVPTLPPPPPSLSPSEPAPIPSTPPTESSVRTSTSPRIMMEQSPPQSFNQKTRQQLLNLANQLPDSPDNPGIVQQLKQEIQQNQGN